MYTIRKSSDRGRGQHGWLESYHTFSFGDYHDPAFMGFRTLRVMNEDRVAPAQGFGTHGHRDMEIISYVLEGELEHRDNLGTGSILAAGDFQCMSAGAGVTHSEFNASKTELVHFYQIWILPRSRGLEPSYQELKSVTIGKQDRLALVASPEGSEGSLRIQQDVLVYIGALARLKTIKHRLGLSGNGWLQVLRGSVRVDRRVDSIDLEAGDGLSITEESEFTLLAIADSELLLFDLK